MEVNIIRGQNQIGGSIVEVSTENTRIIFDAGIELEETGSTATVPEIDGLFCGEKKYDAVFVSHYHADHIGLLSSVLDGIPIYMGRKSYNMVLAAAEYQNKQTGFSVDKYDYVKEYCCFNIGDFRVIPIACDHSAYDAYMYLIATKEKTVLYTGDFRANGRMNSDVFFHKLPVIDALIIEGTTLSRKERQDNLSEEKLEDIAVKCLEKHHGPAFIMMSAMNIDRLITACNVAHRTNRVLLEDLYVAGIAKASEEKGIMPNVENRIRVFMTTGDEQRHERLASYGNARIGKEQIAESRFLMCIRPSMRNYLEKLNKLCSFEDGVLFWGMWKGYLERPEVREFVAFMEDKGVKLHILHTSGHADEATIDHLIDAVKPKQIIPMHTENSKWFLRYEPEIAVSIENSRTKIL